MIDTETLLAAAHCARRAYAEPAAVSVPGNGGPVQRAAQVGTIISVVIIATVSLVGVLILANIDSALPKDQLYNDPANETDPTAFGQSSEAVLSGFDGAMQLVPVVLLVLVAALVIGVVQRMRQQR